MRVRLWDWANSISTVAMVEDEVGLDDLHWRPSTDLVVRFCIPIERREDEDSSRAV